MAVTSAHLVTAVDTTDQTIPYVTGLITPTANRLVLAWVSQSAASAPASPTLDGNALTWVEVATVVNGSRRFTLFRAMGAVPVLGAVTITGDGSTITMCGWSISEFAGVSTGGTNGSSALIQSVTNTASGAASLTVTLGAFAGVGNATVGGFMHSANSSITEGSGFTILGQAAGASPNTTVGSEFLATDDTSVDASAPTTPNWSGIAAEIGTPAAGTFVPRIVMA